MTKSEHAEMIHKLDMASEHRKACEMRENKIRRLRNVFLGSLLISVLLVIASQIYIDALQIKQNQIALFYKMMPVVEYLALGIGILSLVWLGVAFYKSFDAEKNLNKARRFEGYMVKNIFRLMFIDSKK